MLKLSFDSKGYGVKNPTLFLLIRHSKYNAILSEIHSTDCFFGDFVALKYPLGKIFVTFPLTKFSR